MTAENLKETIKSFEKTLKRYRSELEKDPASTFYSGLVKNTEEYIAELKEELKKQNSETSKETKTKLINEATTTDIRIINLLQSFGWFAGDTLLYQQEYKLTPEQQAQFTGIKSIKPDIVLQDMNGEILAVIENKLEDERKGIAKTKDGIFCNT